MKSLFERSCCAGVGGELYEWLGGIATVMGATRPAAAASKVIPMSANLGRSLPSDRNIQISERSIWDLARYVYKCTIYTHM